MKIKPSNIRKFYVQCTHCGTGRTVSITLTGFFTIRLADISSKCNYSSIDSWQLM